jgi:hypothetical protein
MFSQGWLKVDFINQVSIIKAGTGSCDEKSESGSPTLLSLVDDWYGTDLFVNLIELLQTDGTLLLPATVLHGDGWDLETLLQDDLFLRHLCKVGAH